MEHLCYIYSSRLLQHVYKLYKHYTLTSEAAGKVILGWGEAKIE